MKTTLRCPCGEGRMIFEVDPGYAPKATLNPDNPAFSDPGSGPEVITAEGCDACGREPDDEDMEAAVIGDDDDGGPEEPEEREWD